MPEALQNRVRSLTKAKGESVLAGASSLLEGVKRADFDAVLKVAPGRSYEDRIARSLVMASSLAQQDLDFHCDRSEELDMAQALRASMIRLLGEMKQAEEAEEDAQASASAAITAEEDALSAHQLAAAISTATCSGFLGVLDPACYIGMICEAIKGDEWNSAYEAMGAAVEVTYEDEKQLATPKGQLVHEQDLDWDAQNALMACLIKCAMSRTEPSYVGGGLSSEKQTLASAVPDKQASSGDSQKPIQRR